MKINFTKEHKEKILNYIKEYQNINDEYRIYNEKMNTLQKEINELSEKLKTSESNLQSIREKEKEYMEELHSIYGNFTLNDLWDSLQ